MFVSNWLVRNIFVFLIHKLNFGDASTCDPWRFIAIVYLTNLEDVLVLRKLSTRGFVFTSEYEKERHLSCRGLGYACVWNYEKKDLNNWIKTCTCGPICSYAFCMFSHWKHHGMILQKPEGGPCSILTIKTVVFGSCILCFEDAVWSLDTLNQEVSSLTKFILFIFWKIQRKIEMN